MYNIHREDVVFLNPETFQELLSNREKEMYLFTIASFTYSMHWAASLDHAWEKGEYWYELRLHPCQVGRQISSLTSEDLELVSIKQRLLVSISRGY